MCLPREPVIVIVKLRRGQLCRCARFKYINVCEESTMVAWLPQQILLVLVLATATMTSYTTEQTSIKWSSTNSRRTSQSPNPRPVTRHKMQGNVDNELSERTESVSGRISSRRINVHPHSPKPLEISLSNTSDRMNNITNPIRYIESVNDVWSNDPAGPAENPLNSKLMGMRRISDVHLTTNSPSTITTMRKSFEWSREPKLKANERTSVRLHSNPVDDVYPSGELNSHRARIIGHSSTAQNTLDSSIDSLQFQLDSKQDQVTPVFSSTTTATTTTTTTAILPVDMSSGGIVDDHLNWHSNGGLHLVHRYHDQWHPGSYDDGITLTTTGPSLPRRYMRDVPESSCEKFEIGDENRRELYSPHYPQPYPPSMDCVRILDAGEGMLIKLDFRDRFDIEAPRDNNDCKYDYLEVRDGQYGFSNEIGKYCDKTFPPEITSKGRYLWLHFFSDENIQRNGFKAIWTTVPRPTIPGVPPEIEPCIINVTNKSEELINSTTDYIKEQKIIAEKAGVPLDCLWVIQAKPGWKMQLSFDEFKLEKPNDCDANYLDVFEEKSQMDKRLKNFCGSIAETLSTKTNIMYLRFYLEPKAINSSFKAVMTAFREKKEPSKPCEEGEHDCDDATCIAWDLRCNRRQNCRLGWDEDPSICGQGKSLALDSTRMVIILVILALIMAGLTFIFFFNCIRKLVRDHRIIREHIRQSRENRLDEIGRKSTPCPISVSQTDIRQLGSESPSLEIVSNKELIAGTTILGQDYTKELVLEMKYNAKEIIDIHQSNNVSNATQEMLQETEEPQMCDSSCQTRESLFDPRLPELSVPSPAFSTFGYRNGSQNGVTGVRQLPPRTPSQTYGSPSKSNTPKLPSSQCSSCSPASRGRDASGVICPKHAPIPAPPGWSVHDPPYAAVIASQPEPPEYPSYQRYQSPKPERDQQSGHHQPGIVKQRTIGSGERYGSFLYGSDRGSNTASNTNTSSSQHSSTPKQPQQQQQNQKDSRYRAEAVIEVDQKRPFSIESTKSAPDVIATH